MALRPVSSGKGSNAGDKVAEQVVLQALNLERLKADEVKRVLSILEDLSKDLAEKIAEADPTGVGPSTYRQRRMAALFDQVNRTIKDTYRQLNKTTGNIVKGVVSAEAKAAALAINRGAYGGVMLAGLPTVAQLQAISSEVLIMGSPSKEWWGQQAGDLENRFKTQIRQGMVLGEGVDELTARIRGTKANDFKDGIMNLPKSRAEALVRSSVQSASNAARLNTFQANADLLNGYQWLATLDGRTSDTCKARSGLRWDVDFEPVGNDKTWSAPPAHWNCRSTVIPWLKSFADLSKTGKVLKRTKGEKLDSYFQQALTAMGISDASKIMRRTQSSLDGQVAGDLNYEAWLASKSPKFQKEVLGEARYNLFQEGKISLLDLVDQSSNPITLSQLEDLVDQGKVSLIKFDKQARKDAIEAAKAKAKQAKVIESTEDEALAWLATWPKEKKFNQSAYDNAKKKNAEWENMTAQQRKTLVTATFDDMQQKYWQSAAANKIKNGKKLGKKEQKFWDSADPDYKDAVLAKFAKQKADSEALEETLALEDGFPNVKAYVDNTMSKTTDSMIPNPSAYFAFMDLVEDGYDDMYKNIAAALKLNNPEKYMAAVKKGELDLLVINKINKIIKSDVDFYGEQIKAIAKANNIDLNESFLGFLLDEGGGDAVAFTKYMDKFKVNMGVALEKAKDEYTVKFNTFLNAVADDVGKDDLIKAYLIREEGKDTLKSFLDEFKSPADVPSAATTAVNVAIKTAEKQADAAKQIVKTKKKVSELDPEATLLTNEKAEMQTLQRIVTLKKMNPEKSMAQVLSDVQSEVDDYLVVFQKEASEALEQAAKAGVVEKATAKSMREALDEGAAKYKAEVESLEEYVDDKIKFMDGTMKELAEDIYKPYTIEQAPTMLDFDIPLSELKTDFIEAVDEFMKDFNKVKLAVKQANPEFATMAEAKAAALTLIKKVAKEVKEETGVSQAPFNIFSKAEVQALKGGLAKAAKQQKDLADARAQGLLFDDFDQIGPQGGSNVGALYQSKVDGQKFYIKAPDSEVQAKIEILSSKLYKMAGVRAAEVSPIKLKGTIGRTNVDGRLGVASKIEDITDIDAKGIAALDDVQDGFAADAWLANWDVIGNGGPQALNIKRLADGSAFRIDTGATMRFRAQGGIKAFPADKVNELETLRKTDVAQEIVFGDIGDAKIVQGVARIVAINDDDIRRVVKETMGDDADDLAEVLIGRKNFLAKKYKKELAALNKKTKPKPVKDLEVTPEEYDKVVAGRGNGYSQLRDKDQIEDQEVLMWNFTNPDGTAGGGLSFKVRDKLSKKLNTIFRDQSGVDSYKPPRLDGLNERITTMLRSLGARARDGKPMKASAIEDYNEIVEEFGRIKNEITDAVTAGRFSENVLDDFAEAYKPWLKDIETTVYNNDTVAPVIFKPHTDNLFEGQFKLPKPNKIEVGDSPWSVDDISFTRADIDKGFLKYTSADDLDNVLEADGFKATVKGLVYRADDIEIRYIPTSNGRVALRDLIDVRMKNPSPERYEEAMAKLKELGVDLSKATSDDIELSYIEKYFYLFDTKKDEVLAGSIEAGIIKKAREAVKGVRSQTKKLEVYREAMKDILEVRTGQKIDNLLDFPTYRPQGRTEYWGNGRTFFDRPDFFGSEWDEFAEEYVLRHDFTYGGGDVVNVVRNILNGGGVMATTLDKLRRGVRVSGASPSRDLSTGGAAYNFTRLERKRQALTRAGIVFKPNILRRMDSITYDYDHFGRTVTDGGRNFVTQNRYTSLSGMRIASQAGNNETIFKNSLSIFEDVVHINVYSEAERQRLIDVFIEAGYLKWPDGRHLDEVIVVA